MSATEHAGVAKISATKGNVHVALPEGSYLDMTPAAAERFASRLLVEASRAKRRNALSDKASNKIGLEGNSLEAQ